MKLTILRTDPFSSLGGFWAAQSPANAYQHGMRNGDTDPEQTVEEASSLWAQFIEEKLALARSTSDTARASKNCKSEKDALVLLGQAFHAYSDSLSPAHEGFQPWYSPKHFADAGAFWSDPIPPWLQFVHDHSQQETLDVYKTQGYRSWVPDAIAVFYAGDLAYILATPSL